MSKLKKIGIGFGIAVLAFFVLMIVAVATYDDSAKTSNERPIQLEENPETVTKQKDEKLNTKDLQTVIAGFEAYNKSVKILLDACVAVETEDDFRLLGQVIAEQGENFLVITSEYGAARDKLIAEGYGKHSVLGPLMNESAMLVDGMSACMEVLAWEFSG